MPETPPILTPASPEDLRDLLIAGHISAAGEPPSYNRLGVAWAQVMIETARGEKIWNHNVGNLKCSGSCQDERLWTMTPALPPEYPIQRAYVGPIEGCASYWRLIFSSRYAPALPLFDAGDASGAMMEMGRRGYFEAPPVGYANTAAALFAEYQSKWTGPPADSWGEKHSTLIVVGSVLVGIGTAAYIFTR